MSAMMDGDSPVSLYKSGGPPVVTDWTDTGSMKERDAATA